MRLHRKIGLANFHKAGIKEVMVCGTDVFKVQVTCRWLEEHHQDSVRGFVTITIHAICNL